MMIKGAQCRFSKRMYRECISVQEHGDSFRKAEERYHAPKSTLNDAERRQAHGKSYSSAGRPTLFTSAEEICIVEMLEPYVARGVTFTRLHLIDAIALFVEQLPVA